MKTIDRRSFIKGSLGGAAALALSSSKAVSANDKVVLGFMGVGGRGTFLAERFAKRPDVEIAYLCDVNVRRFGKATEAVVSSQKGRPKLVQDFRKMLDDKSVDAIVNATPDHWHALGTIMACQAGKDVFVEKPLSLTLAEGRKMVEAARKYKRVVTAGIQSRSARYFQDGVDYIRKGNIGKVHLVRVYNMMQHSPSPRGPEEAVPNGFDWDMWLGPCEKTPYSPGRWHFNLWEYSLGGIAGDLIHQLDLARALADKAYPKTVSHDGGVYHLKDGRNIPDTQIVTYGYDDDFTLITESALWTPYMKKTPFNVRDMDEFPNFPFSSTKIEVFGTKGFMNLSRHGGGWQVHNEDSKVIASQFGRQADAEHQEDFINCIRTRNKPVGDVEECHRSTLMCHLGHASYRTGNKKLEFDSKTETVTNNNEANKYLTKQYRKPWVLPEKV